MTIIYLLPHFDDEIFIIPKIRTDRENGHSQLFIFFMSSPLRANESLRFLQKLGIAPEKVLLMGDKFAASDGRLLNYLIEFYNEIISLTQIHKNDTEIVCPAFEGGHHDHDAISILGRALSKSWQCNFFEFYLYHGYGTQGKFYSVCSPLTKKNGVTYKYGLSDLVLLFTVPFLYPSQKKAMLGLWPFLLVKSLIYPLFLTLNNSKKEIELLHSEVPLYERWGRISQLAFQKKINEFMNFLNI